MSAFRIHFQINTIHLRYIVSAMILSSPRYPALGVTFPTPVGSQRVLSLRVCCNHTSDDSFWNIKPSRRDISRIAESSRIFVVGGCGSDRHVRCRAQSQDVAGALHVFSPAKINVFLRVVRRRDDGFHDLASLFHVIDLGDDMDVSVLPPDATRDELTCNWADVPVDGSNLVIKAARLFREKTGRSEHFKVHLEKRVPHGAGMGGGSGNAATMLWAANALCGTPATNEQLLEWSGEIGSDISVFFSQGAAYCTGRGEIVENISPPPISLDTPLLLVKPPVGLSTPQIFKALDLDRRSTVDPKEILGNLCRGVTGDASNFVNDLEQPAFDCLPELQNLKNRLIEEGDFDSVFMTGSGSTIVCIGSDTVPEFLKTEPEYANLFISPARLMVRDDDDSWYTKN